MFDLRLQDVARITGGQLLGAAETELRGVVADSRAVRGGELFVALSGQRTDGHRFLDAVLAAGAGAALVAPDRGVRPAGLPAVVVADPQQALGLLARDWLFRLAAPVVGITGSVGKTTAKDFLAQLLGGGEAGIHAAPASFNSEIGLPLAVLSAPRSSRLLVLEYGINAPGEMVRLLGIAPPAQAWLTALSEVHLEGMRDLETVAREKAQLAAAVPEAGGIWLGPGTAAVLGGRTAGWRGRIHAGGLEGCGARVLSRAPGAWRVELPGLGVVELPLVARHEVELAVTAAQIALQEGTPAAALRRALPRLRRPPGRLTVHRACGWTLLDDAYNASPAATRAALEVLDQWPRTSRRVAVLGTMHELGAATERCHREIGALAARVADLVLAVGEGAAWLAAGADGKARMLPDAGAALAELRDLLRPGDTVLLKASRAEGLDALVSPLLALGEKHCCAGGGQP